MGEEYSFKCDKCGYEAFVSGGMDFGFVAVTQTMVCYDCHKLVDVLIGSCGVVGKTGDPEIDPVIGLCPDCNGKNVSVWEESGPCLKCGGTMIKGELVLLWD